MGWVRSGVCVCLTAVLIRVLPVLLKTKPQLSSHFDGDTKPAFQNVKKVFRENFELGLERAGASLTVYHRDRIVVNLWGGYADLESQRLWEKDTLTVAYSATKVVTALVGAMLADRGVIDYDTAVIRYWPEFGQHGKDNVTVRQLLSHEAGLAAIDEEITKKDVTTNWKRMGRHFENQKPNWPPGTARGYHTVTYGWLMDQLLRRVDVDERSLGKFIKEELSDPNKLEFYLGLPPKMFHRVARQYAPTIRDALALFWEDPYFVTKQLTLLGELLTGYPKNSLRRRVLVNPDWFKVIDGFTATNDPEILAMEIGAANGVCTSKGLAALLNLIFRGKIFQRGTKVLEEIQVPRWNNTEVIFGLKGVVGHGFIYTESPTGTQQMGHPGYGGQNAKIDMDNELVIVYLTNDLKFEIGDKVKPWARLQKAIYEAIQNVV